MNLFKKLIFFSLSFFGVFVGYFTFAVEGSDSEDLLNQAFEMAVEGDRVVGKQMGGNTKEWVGNWLLGGVTVIGGDDKEALIIAVARFLVRFTLVFAITMIIYNGVMFVIKSSKGELAKDTLKNIIYIVVGVLLALMSVVIIRLANSVGTTTLDIGDKNIISYHDSCTFYL